MSGVGRDRVRLPLLAVQRHGVERLVLGPERLLEPAAQGLGVRLQAAGEILLPAHAREPGQPGLGVEHVALDLGQRDRGLGEATLAIADAIPASPSSPG